MKGNPPDFSDYIQNLPHAPAPNQTDSRLHRIEKILLGLEWAGVSVENVSEAGGECVYTQVDHFCLLCGGYSTEQPTIPSSAHSGHRDGCLFLELPR